MRARTLDHRVANSTRSRMLEAFKANCENGLGVMGREKGCIVFVFVCILGSLDSGESGVFFLAYSSGRDGGRDLVSFDCGMHE
jgi:hypothetical protein